MRVNDMATALSIGRVQGTGQLFAELFRREVRPHLDRLERLQTRQRQRLVMEVLIGAAATIGTIVLLARIDLTYATMGGLLAAMAGVVLVHRTQQRYLNEVRTAVMPGLCAAIGDITHTTGHAPRLELEQLAEIGLLPRHHRRVIDDVFEGRYRELGFTVAEVQLRSRRRSRKGGAQRVFRGLVFAIETPQPIPGRILIAKDAGLLGNWAAAWIRSFRGLQRVPVPHEAFEERFEVYADDPAQVRRTVTPGVCEALVALADGHADQPVQAVFAGQHFHLAIPKRRDQFRLGSLFRSLGSLEREAGRVLHDAQLVHRLIDDLYGDRPSRSRRRA